MLYCFFFLIISNFVFSLRRTDFGSAFSVLPSSVEWESMVKDLNGTEIKEIVHIYMLPIIEFQKAARNREINVDDLKNSFLTAISLLQESARNFALTSDEYQDAKRDINSFLIMPSAAFKLKKAEKLQPVFSVESLSNFSRQRLKHMLGRNDSSYITFLMHKNAYESTLEEWNVIGSRIPTCSYRELLARNLDLSYIEHVTAVYLNAMRIRRKSGKSIKLPRILRFIGEIQTDNLVKNIEALGNGYSTSKPPYSSFLIIVCTFYAILLTVMF